MFTVPVSASNTTFTSPRFNWCIYVCGLLLQRALALALAVVRRVPRDELHDHGAQRGRLERGVGDFDRLRAVVFVQAVLIPCRAAAPWATIDIP
jgi:hypothetical protein